jgi:type I restriction-modification system DNA methylase subunit
MSHMNNKVKKLIKEESKKYTLSRSKERQSSLGEVFTPTDLVIEILEALPKGHRTWKSDKTFLDPSCGNGQFLAAILIRKIELKHKNPLETVYGVDIMQDNVDECRQRLLAIAGNTERNRAIVERNIVCADGLTYDYSFGETEE